MIYMNAAIEIHYISNETKVMQRGSFPLKGRTPEQTAFDFWREVKRRMPFGGEIWKVLINNEDKTEEVKKLEKAPLK